MTSFWKNSLSEMWQHRATGDLAQAEICFMDVVSALNLDISLPIKSQIDVLFRQVKRDDRSLIADILMYPAARLRGYYKLSESWLVIREFEEASRPRGLHLSFQFLLQKGLNHLTTGQHTEALCCFKFAERVARSVDETFLARVNSLLMEESLGLNIASVLRKFDSDFRAFCIENKDLSLILKTVKVQYTALRIRQSFLSGDFSELARLTVLSDETRGFARQSAWHCVWISALPYVEGNLIANYSRCLESLELGILSFQTTFRLATLKGRLLQADFDGSRPLTDKIDRLYLWTWSWMMDPKSDHLERIIIWCEHVMNLAAQQDLGRDDELKLRNACRWLGYFCGISDQEIKSKITFVPDHELERFPLFDFESHLLDFLNARKGSTSESFSVIVPDELNHLIGHSAQNIRGFLLPQALNHLIPELDLVGRSAVRNPHNSASDTRQLSLVALLRNLLLNPITPIDHRNIIVQIDPFDERISIGKSKQDVFLPLTMTANLYKLFLTLMGSGSALINEVLDHCYGIKNYDPTIHDAKLAQLVTQANITLRAYFAFKRRRNTIVMTSLNGPFTVTSKGSWKHITAIYKYRERVWQTFSMTARAPCRTPEAAPKEVSPVKRVLTPGKWVAREEIEGFFGVSKATICRRISSWVKNGDLQKQGVGRRTVYLVNQEFLNNHAEKFVTH